MRVTINLQTAIIFLLIPIWGTSIPTGIIYGLFFLMIFITLFYLIYKRTTIPVGKKEDWIPFLFFLVWFYGFLLGIVRGNNTGYVMANFAGMICYLGYYIFTIFDIDTKKLAKIILSCGFLVCFFAIVRLFKFIFNVNIPFLNILLGEDIGMASTGQLRVYFTTLAVGYGLLGTTFLVAILKYKSDIKLLNRYSWLLLVLSVTAILFVSASKGFLLGGLFILFYVYVVYNLKSIFSFKINKSILFILFFCGVLFYCLIYFDYLSIIELMFDSSDNSNNIRYEQLVFLLEDCSIFGKGLGAVVPGVLRDADAPYGVELTFINLIHKFGFFSLVLFWGWLYLGYKLTISIYRRTKVFESVLALSSLGYLFPSIGNPLLMHPSLVLLNCASIYFLKKINYEK